MPGNNLLAYENTMLLLAPQDIAGTAKSSAYVNLANCNDAMLFVAVGNITTSTASQTDGPVITVEATEEGEMVRVSVSDNGKGWPKENRNRLLEPYVTTREKGTGLGLAIVAKIIEQHGGKVDLVDAEPDENGRTGAAFTFTLPLRRVEEDEGDADPSPTTTAADQQSAPVVTEGAAGGAEPGTHEQGEPQLQAAENN